MRIAAVRLAEQLASGTRIDNERPQLPEQPLLRQDMANFDCLSQSLFRCWKAWLACLLSTLLTWAARNIHTHPLSRTLLNAALSILHGSMTTACHALAGTSLCLKQQPKCRARPPMNKEQMSTYHVELSVTFASSQLAALESHGCRVQFHHSIGLRFCTVMCDVKPPGGCCCRCLKVATVSRSSSGAGSLARD